MNIGDDTNVMPYFTVWLQSGASRVLAVFRIELWHVRGSRMLKLFISLIKSPYRLCVRPLLQGLVELLAYMQNSNYFNGRGLRCMPGISHYVITAEILVF